MSLGRSEVAAMLGACHFKGFSGDHLEFCTVAHELGYAWTELKYEPRLDQRYMLTSSSRDVRDFVGTVGMRLSVHASYDDPINIGSPDPGIRSMSVKACQESLDYASAVGAEYMTVHGGHLLPGEDVEGEFDRLKERSIDALGALVARAGQAGVTVCIENRNNFNRDKIRFPVTIEDLLVCATSIGERVAFTVDSGHANSTGMALPGFISLLGPSKVALTHLHDNDGTADQHLVPGDGEIDFKGFVAGWLSSGWKFPLLFELLSIDAFRVARKRMLDLFETVGREAG